MRKHLLIAAAACYSFALNAQAPVSWSSAEMYQAIQKLKVLGTVLYVAAHPDDENTRLLSYLSKDRLYRTGYLSITRGDGGQNLIGEEQGIELGLIRTQELLAARRIDGGEQFFTRAYDFGYSKNPEETFAKWDKDRTLSDVVWVIRKFQPDVIITRFPTTGEGGHGHHTASAILANEAFSAAADPTKFPEQLKYVKPWQAKRVLWNTFNFGGNNLTRDDQFKIDVGGYNPLLGKSYGEIAAESRSQHKSQGFGVPASRGEALEYFKGTQGTQPLNDLFEEIDITWKRVPGGVRIEQSINNIASSFDFLHPEKSVGPLVKLYGEIQRIPEGNWQLKKLREVQQLIEQCSGLFIDAFATQQFAVQTDSIRMTFSLNNRLGVNASLQKLKVDGFDSSFSQSLGRNRNFNFSKTFYVPASKSLTQPYWLEGKMAEGYFNVGNQQMIGTPDAEPGYIAKFEINIEGYPFLFSTPVKYKFTDPVRGEVYQPLVVTPAIDINLEPQFLFATKEVRNNVTIRLQGLKTVRLTQPKLGMITPDIHTDEIVGNTDILKEFNTNQVKVFQTDKLGHPLSGPIDIYLKNETDTFNKDLKSIKYEHIPTINYFRNTQIPFTSVRLTTAGKKIGYITGAGDKVPDALEQMGYEVTLLSDKELSRNNLSQFDAIITGIRAYNTNEWMSSFYDKLMKYVENGGNLIVQYNTSNFISSVRSKIGPYNFNIARTRVSVEDAPVTITKPDHQVFNYPNKITPEDFNGWVQERSIYHATAWDKNFESVLAMNDPGEKPDEGGLIIARHGKGTFVYTGLVFFRQLPAGIPGAYRLLANIISLNQQKAF